MVLNELYEGALEPIWFGDRKVYSVTGFVMGVRKHVMSLPSFWVQGEVSDFNYRPNLSVVFFTLKDPSNGFTMSCTMRRNRFDAIGLEITDGDLVQVFGRPEMYAARGSFQLNALTIEHAGRGLLMQQLEALKAKLEREGLFDEERKRPLPFLPRRVGLITGAEAAARDDFLRNITARFPAVKIVMCETLVQGPRSAPLLVAALRKMQQVEDVDVIVLARGGGAFEDFLPFSDERLCREIAACRVPVVSAIGHEKDSPVSDLVADLRVSTPTAATRVVVPDQAQLQAQLDAMRASVRRRAMLNHQRRRELHSSLRARLSGKSPVQLVRDRQAYVRSLGVRASTHLRGMVDRRRIHLGHAEKGLRCIDRRVRDAKVRAMTNRRDVVRVFGSRVAGCDARQTTLIQKLRALSPHATLERGYAIVRTPDGRVVCSADDVVVGQTVTMSLASGTLAADVTEVLDRERERIA